MKKNDYILVQAQMISDLHLKGNELLVFALIHGYTKDGRNRCRASLRYISGWIDTSKSAVIRAINTLEEAGYICRHTYLEGNVECVEYTTNYEALIERASKGEFISLDLAKSAKKTSKKEGGLKMRPATEGAAAGGSQNETGLKMITKGSQNDNGSGLKMRPNNIIDNIRYYFSSRTREEQEEEKKNLFKLFFFRNAADPAAEVERFIAYNESRGWSNSQGMVYETPEQRLALAGLWKFQDERKRCDEAFLKSIENLYNEACEKGVEGREVLLDPKMTLTYDKASDRFLLASLDLKAGKWIEAHIEITKFYIMPLLNGKALRHISAK